MLSKAISIAAKAFENKKDNGGKPYILHCLRVMHGVDQNDEELMTIAVLHDVPEDFPKEYPLLYFMEQGFSNRVIVALALLNHDKKVPYDDYIEAIALNEDAIRVKLSDLQDNSNIHRLKDLSKEDFDRIKKYHRSFAYLTKKIK